MVIQISAVQTNASIGVTRDRAVGDAIILRAFKVHTDRGSIAINPNGIPRIIAKRFRGRCP